MKKSIEQFKKSRVTSILFMIILLTSILASCGDDDADPVVDLDQPVIISSENLTVRGGKTKEINFSVIVPGKIAELKVEAASGTAEITNQEMLVGNSNGTVNVNYATTKDMSGKQTITLSVTDEQGKTNTETAEIEVFAPINFGLGLVSGSGGVVTTFLQGLIDLDVATVDNSNSTELGQFAAVYSDGKSLFAAGFGAPATMSKYVFNSSGEAVYDQEIIVPGSNSFSAIEIISETQAYGTVGGGLSRAVIFNPSEMRITGEINLSQVGTGFFYSDMITSDDFLFIALNDFGSSDTAKIAVVNRQTNTLEKVIKDARTSTFFASLTSAIMTKTANGDIYVQASGLFSEKTSGILRIKAGESDFDPDYFFDLGAATGKSCFGLYHFGDGHTFTATSDNNSNWFGQDGANPVFRYRKIDLAGKADLGDLDMALPNSFSGNRGLLMRQTAEDEILFSISGVDENALYSYNKNSMEVSKKITSNGGYFSGIVPIFE